MGEHAVLQNKKALVCAINKRMYFKLFPRKDNSIYINSALGTASGTITNFSFSPPFDFVSACLDLYQKKFQQGFDLSIESDFSDKVGFGSSAAITVGVTALLYWWLYQKKTRFQIII